MKQPRTQNLTKPPRNGNGNGHSHIAIVDREIPRHASNRSPLVRFFEPFTSLKLTVALLAMAMVLIFVGTTIQGEMGIWDVQKLYFHSWITFIEWRLFFPLWP